MLVTGAGSQACALREWDHSFQALVVPAVAHPAFPPFHGCLEEFLFPTCVQRLEDLPFSRTNLQWKAEARLQGLPGDRLPISGFAIQREENSTEEPQVAWVPDQGNCTYAVLHPS